MRNNLMRWVGYSLLSLGALLCLDPTAHAGLSRSEKQELKTIHTAYQAGQTDELNESVTLEEALRYGALHNAGLRSSFYQWKASAHDIKQAASLEDPEFSFKFFIEEVETRVGAQKQMFSIGQKIPFPGKLITQGQAATALSRQKFADYQKTKLQYFYELKDAYFEYWFLYKNILVTEKNQELLGHFESVAQSKFKSSMASNQDLLKAQVELGKIENDLLTLNDYRWPIIARLNAVLNRSVEMTMGWPEEINHEIQVINEKTVFEKFEEHNPDLERAVQRIEETQRKVLLARLDYLPDTMITFDYTNVSRGPMNVADNGHNASALMFKVNLPLWYGKQKSQLEETKSLSEAAHAEHEQIENNLAAKIKMLYFKIKDAERQINLYRDALIPKAEQSLNASETAYSASKVDFLNLIDNQRTLLSFQLSYYKSIRDYEQRLAELEMIIGESLRGENHG